MSLHRPILGASFAALLASLVASARAEAPTYTTTWSQEALAGIVQEDPESPALRALRLAEEELFAHQSAEEPRSDAPEGVLGAATDGEPPPLEYVRDGKTIDVAFLKDLKLPSLPVRWDARVIEYLLFFKNDPRGRDLASGWLRRHERYGPMLRRTLSEHALPTDLQYVAMIESGYDPRARSAVDALGMWQFLQEPAEQYGLRVDHWVDERLDPERSTVAAARFMRELYERFGSWELSFAAYNMGYGGLLRAIRKYNTNDYWRLSHLEAGLPFETSLYVAKITAMALVAHNPAVFGFAKLAKEPQLQLAKIDVAAGTSLEHIAKVAELPLAALQEVNPHLKRSRIPPGEPSVQVYLPREAQVRFVQRWSTQRDRANPIGYVLRLGETLDDLAQRTHLSVQQLRELNELPSDVHVAHGFPLLVPRGKKPTADLVEPLVASVPAEEFQLPGRKRVFYRVASEDTPETVARFFDVTLDELNSWNQLAEGAALQQGMLLQLFVVPELDLSRAVVFRPDEVRILTVGSDAFFDYHEAQRGRVRVRYRVQPDDSLSSLAERFDLSAGSIARINQFSSQRELERGEWVTVYVAAGEADKLAQAGLIERIGAEPTAAAPGAGRDEVDRELAAAERKPPVATRKEGPVAPPKKTRSAVAAQAKPIEKRIERAPKRGSKRSR